MSAGNVDSREPARRPGGDEIEGAGAGRARSEMRIPGESFHVELDGDLGVVVSHPRWSPMGYGDSLSEAEKALTSYARELAETMADDSPRACTSEGNRLRDFVLALSRPSSTVEPASRLAPSRPETERR